MYFIDYPVSVSISYPSNPNMRIKLEPASNKLFYIQSTIPLLLDSQGWHHIVGHDKRTMMVIEAEK